MKYFYFITLAFILLISCTSNKAQIEEINRKIASTDEKISILTEQLILLNSENLRTPQEIVIEVTQPQTEQVTHPSLSEDELNRLYNNGMRQYNARDYPGAIRTFQVIIARAPAHELAANAQYWTGESYYGMGDFTAARHSFQIVVEQYPNSNKFLDSQVKIAMTWIRQNRPETARSILEFIRRNYPNYERMALVEQNLRAIR